MRRLGVLLVLGLVVGVTAWLALRLPDPGQGPTVTAAAVQPPMYLAWAEIAMVPFPELLIRPGEVVAARRFELAPRSAGRLTELLVRPGDRVAPGAALAHLAAPELVQALHQAQAELGAARAELLDAESDLARLTTLAKTRAVSDDTRRDAEVRRNRASALAAAAEAAVASRQETVGELTLRAPEALLVLDRLREPGDLAGPAQPILLAESAKGRRFDAWVPLGEARRLHLGMPVMLRLDGETAALAAELTGLVASADPATRTCKVEVALADSLAVPAGTFGELRIRLGESRRVAVSEAALRERAGVTGAFVRVAPGEVRFRSVRTGQRFDGLVEVLAGLQPGDRVVSDPPPALRDGTRVEPPGP